ncbi:GNAT family N-acetyltransferase [Candidatus Poribacteria bacterium]
MQNPFIIGDKIYLRPREMEDSASFVKWLNDEEVRQYMLMTSPLNIVREREFVESRLYKDDTDIRLGIALKETDQLIGGIGLTHVSVSHRRASLGIFIGDKSCWSKGYGTEALKLMIEYAFDELNLHRVHLSVFDFNPRAMRAYEKAGFKREGVFRDAAYKNGKYRDMYPMAILESEWREHNRDREAGG